jgi:hypothetical protein
MFTHNQEILQLFFEHNMHTHGINIIKEIIKGNSGSLVESLILYQQKNNSPINISSDLNCNTLEINPKINEIFVKLYENGVITKDRISNLYYNNIKLLEYPVKDSCAIDYNPVDVILSNTYSKIEIKNNLETHLIESVKNSMILNDIISVISTSTLDDNIFIQFVDIKNHDSQMVGSAGYIRRFSNQIIIQESEKYFNFHTLMHELTHYSMSKIFKNSFNPYRSEAEKELFNIAKKNTLLNIDNLLREKFNNPVNDFETSVYKLNQELDTTQIIKNYYLMSCLTKMLNTYNYQKQEEDKEFIAHYVEVMSENHSCHNLLKNITSPLEEYWEAVLSPKVISYDESHNINTCGAIKDYDYYMHA